MKARVWAVNAIIDQHCNDKVESIEAYHTTEIGKNIKLMEEIRIMR